MKYGSISLIVQDGKMIWMDKTEKYRLEDRLERPEVFAEKLSAIPPVFYDAVAVGMA